MSDSIKSNFLFFPTTLLVLVILLSGCGNQDTLGGLTTLPVINPPIDFPELIESYPELHRNPNVEPDYTPIAENSVLRLYVNHDNSAIIIEDLRSSTFWRSSPADLDSHEGTTQIWRELIEMPIQISYVDAARAQQKNIKPEEVVYGFHAVDDGVRVSYGIPDFNLALDVIYAIQDDCLTATIPSGSITEDGENSLVSIDLLAFMGATHDGEKGYMVYPDGSGALLYFDTPHPPEVQKILTTIYGDAFLGNQTSVYREQIRIPVFGLVKDGSAFVGMITQGEFDAELGIARSGKGINYNHIWAQFIYRRQGRFSLTGGQPVLLYQPDRIPGDRQVRYCFTNGEKANYVDMASRYRQFLIDERGATRIKERLGEDIPLMNLIFFMGIERRNWFLADMVLMTHFDDVSQMMAELDSLGIDKADVSLWFWNKGGTSGKYPKRLPVDKRLGGEEELRKMIDYLHDLDYKIFLQDDYLFVNPGNNDIQPFQDAVRGVDGLPAGNPEIGYLLNPQVALREFALPILPTIGSYGADGLLFENFADMVLPDKNSRYPLARENFAATWMEIAIASRKELGSVAMAGGNIYAVPYTDRLDFVTLDSTHYDFFDETIPLYHIAVHGLLIYTGAPYNFLSDSQTMFLHQVEYGALPVFLLTRESSSLLFRTGANGVYSSKFETWKEEILRQYQAMESLAPTLSQFITGHDLLTNGVTRTTFEDSTQVIINYNSEPYNADTIIVPPQDFIVVGGN